MSEKEYKDMVLADYEMKKAAGLLLAELVVHTPGNIKAACEIACERRFNPKDEIILESFFNKRDNAAAYLKVIKLAKADLFRPLNSYLGKPSVNPTIKNINLLAWLIDFQPRPFHRDLVVSGRPNLGSSRSTKVGAVETSKSSNYLKMIALLLALAGVVIGYFIYHSWSRVNGDEDCMIWSDDRFLPVYCKDQPVTTLKWPIERNVIKDFRKIEEPDTLTYYSVRKVFYANYKGRHEFYTMNGPFPLDTTRRLLPMTTHILEKYVFHIKN